MDLQVTTPLEQAIRRVPGVSDVRSTTSRGSAEISVSFDWGTDMAAATLQVDAATAQVMPQLPPGTVKTRRMDPTVFPSSRTASRRRPFPYTVRDIADYRSSRCSRVLPASRDGVIGGGARNTDSSSIQPAAGARPDAGRRLEGARLGERRERRGQARGSLQAAAGPGRRLAPRRRRHRPDRRLAAAAWSGRRRRHGHRTRRRQWTRVTADGRDAVVDHDLPAAGRQQRADRQRRPAEAGSTSPVADAEGRQARELVRPERARDPIGRQRARCDPDRRWCWRRSCCSCSCATGASRWSRCWSCRRRSPSTVLVLSVIGTELQHHDARRHGRGRRPGHRRRRSS